MLVEKLSSWLLIGMVLVYILYVLYNRICTFLTYHILLLHNRWIFGSLEALEFTDNFSLALLK